MKNSFLLQVTKYGIIGALNTLLTAVIIWMMMYLVFRAGETENVSPAVITISNTTGFVIGFLISFVFNRKWTFQSKNHWKNDFFRFSISFIVCYIPQLLLVNFLNTQVDGNDLKIVFKDYSFVISYPYICQLIGIVFYTSLNFTLNKFYAFKQRNVINT